MNAALRTTSLTAFMLFTSSIGAQSNPGSSASVPRVSSSFMGTSLIHMPTTRALDDNTLEVRINHRFGSAKTGFDDFFGLDTGANVQLSADYGMSDSFSFGLARTSDYKTYELRSKYVALAQTASFPITLAVFAAGGQETQKEEVTLGPLIENLPKTGDAILDAAVADKNNQRYRLTNSDKRSYLVSVLASRAWGSAFTLQLAPMFVHRNFVKTGLKNDRWGMSLGARAKLGDHIDLTFETIATRQRDYIGDDYETVDKQSYPGLQTLQATDINRGNLGYAYLRNVYFDKPVPHYYVPASIGLDIDTGGHVFQVFISNSRALAHTQLLRGADFDYKKKDYVVGFNLSRLFWFSEGTQSK